jgi:predicted TIM-barrel fold metal-dependent hydrolase
MAEPTSSPIDAPGLHGRIIDMHSHFFPEKLFASIWEWFDLRSWGIRYRLPPAELAANLRDLGVRRFVTYNYAHKAGMAADLYRWTAGFAREEPGAVPFATVFPADEGNVEMLASLFDEGFAGVKIQPLVSDFYPCDERMSEVYELLVARGKILAVHAGTAPVANEYVGADHFEPVMRRFPDMKVIVAHMGAFEFDRFFALVHEYPNLYLDTSVNFIDSALMADLIDRGRFPPLEVPSSFDPDEISGMAHRLLFGSDYPNIPYTYEDCIESIRALGLGDEFERKVFFENAEELLEGTKEAT